MPFKSDKQREYFFAKLNSLPKGSEEYNKWKKVVDKFVAHNVDESQDLDEARRNPEVNVEKTIPEQVNQFIEKHKGQEDLIFISFRDSINVTFINPNNEYETPTGIYTYPWKNFYEKEFKKGFTYRESNIIPDLDSTVPFKGGSKYMFMYKLKSNQGILKNESTYNDTLPYANKLLNLVKNNQSALEIVDNYINNYQSYTIKYYDKNKFTNPALGDVHKFWILLYEVVEKIGGKKQNAFSTLCRSIGVNGFVDFGTGYIHPNEKYQAVFFRGRDLFDDIKIIDAYKRNRLRSSYKLDNKEYIMSLETKDIKKLLNSYLDRENYSKNTFAYEFFKKAISVAGKDFINKEGNLDLIFSYLRFLDKEKGEKLIKYIFNINNDVIINIKITNLVSSIYYILGEKDLFNKIITKVILNGDLKELIWGLDSSKRIAVLNDVIYLILSNDELRNLLESNPESFTIVKDYVNYSHNIYNKDELKKFLNENKMKSPLDEIFKSLGSLKEELNEQNKVNVKQKNLEKVNQFLLERKEFLDEQDLDEARSNPEVNVEQPVAKQIEQFVEKHKGQEELIFISFRDSINVTFINPKNVFNTPTGIYTYPWLNFYDDTFKKYVKDYLVANVGKNIPFKGDSKYMFMYKLKSNQGVLTNQTTYNDTLPYANKLLNLVKNNQKALEIVNAYINDYERYITDYYDDNEYANSYFGDVHTFWILLYLVGDYITKGKTQDTIGNLCRAIGVNGFVDFDGKGYIHPSERYQAVFFKGRELFDDIKIIDRQSSPTRIYNRNLFDYINNKEFIENLNADRFDNLIGNAPNNEFINTIIDTLLSNKNFVSNMDGLIFAKIIYYAKMIDKSAEKIDRIIDIVLSNKNFLDVDINDKIQQLLRYATTNEKLISIINTLFNNENYVDKIDSKGIKYIIEYSPYEPDYSKDNIIKYIINNNKTASKIDENNISFLFKNTSKEYRTELINILLKRDDIVNNYNTVFIILYQQSPERRDEIVDELLQNKSFLSYMQLELGYSNPQVIDLMTLLSESSKQKMANKMIEIRPDIVEKLFMDGKIIKFMLILEYSKINLDSIINNLNPKYSETNYGLYAVLINLSNPKTFVEERIGVERMKVFFQNYDYGYMIDNAKNKKEIAELITEYTGEDNSDIIKSLTSLQEELNEQNKMNIKQKNLEKVKNFLSEKRKPLLEDEFYFNSLPDDKKESIYNLFKQSYEGSVGTSWSKDKFYSRAYDWLFFGDENGFVAVRTQKSGLYKLVGVAGSLKSILNGFNELQSKNVPIWGMVSKDIQQMAHKKGFTTPPPFLLKILYKLIPNSVFGNTEFDVNSDGSLTLKYSDVGDAVKYFIGNDEYFKNLKSNILPSMKDEFSKLPSLTKMMINKFLPESVNNLNEELLDEDITSGNVTVYHRTGRRGSASPIQGIAADGYRVGNGAMYGVGVYTTYDLESQIKSNMISAYGNIIIESKVLSLDKFLIFDYDIAKKIYGNINYTLDNQLRLILGKDWNKFKNDIDLFVKELSVDEYTSKVAINFYKTFKNSIVKYLRGMVFTGQQDGKVLISYDRKNVEPLRYTNDEGQTWTNIINKNIYQRLKGYKPEETDTEYEHFRNKLEAKSIDLTDGDIDYIVNNFDKFRKNINSNNLYNILSNSSKNNSQFIVNKLLQDTNFIDRLNTDGIESLLTFGRENRDKVINVLLQNSNIINKLNTQSLVMLIEYSSSPEKVIYALGEKGKHIIKNAAKYFITWNLMLSKEPEIIFNLLEEKKKKYINNLDIEDINNLFVNSKNPEKIIDELVKDDDFIISEYNYYLLTNTKDPKRVIKLLGKNRDKFISKVFSYDINYLLTKSIETEKLVKELNKYTPVLENYINGLNSYEIYELITTAKHPKKLFNVLGQKGIEFINKVNVDYLIGGDLIDDARNYEEIEEILKKYNKLPKNNLNEELLDEDITSGSVTVYHRTGKYGNDSALKGIAADGYRVGGGAMYGVGVYTTYDLESQLQDYLRNTYGNIIIESKVLSMDKFLIFDYDIAKKIYGNVNYTLDNQLRLILGNNWRYFKDNSILKNIIEQVAILKYTADVADTFYKTFTDTIVRNLRGIVFTGRNDGKVLVSYDRKNVEPLRYTTDEAQNWTNIINKNIYQRLKGYKSEEKETHVEHILNKLDVKPKELTDGEINYIIKNIPLFLKRGLTLSKMINFIIEISNDNSKKIIEYIKNIFEKDGQFLSSYVTKEDAKYIGREYNIPKIYSKIIFKLLIKYGGIEFINKLIGDEGIRGLYWFGENSFYRTIIDTMLKYNGKEFLVKNFSEIDTIIYEYFNLYSKDNTENDTTDKFINKMIKIGGKELLYKLATNIRVISNSKIPLIQILLFRITDKNYPVIIDNMLKIGGKEFVNALDKDTLRYIYTKYQNNESLTQKLLKISGKEFADKYKDIIYYLIPNYKDYEKIRDMFSMYDTDQTPINEIFNSLTSLQEELNEQNKVNVKQKNLEKVRQFLLEKKNSLIEQDLDEARRNPEVNYQPIISKQIEQFVEKHKGQEDLLFVSFRRDINVTFINPKNLYGTPTGIYTYPWKNFYDNIFEKYIKNYLIPDTTIEIPYQGSARYIFLYKLKSNQGILTNQTTYNDTLPYGNKLFNLVKNNEYALEIVNAYINDYERYITNYYNKSYYARTSFGDVHTFWILLYLVAERITKGKTQDTIGNLCRAIGVNGFIDFEGKGYIHANEPKQAVFFRGRELFDDIKIIDTQKQKIYTQNLDAIFNDEDFIKNLDADRLENLLSNARNRSRSEDFNQIFLKLIGNIDDAPIDSIFKLFKYAPTVDIKNQLINKLLKNIDFLEKVKDYDFNYFLNNLNSEQLKYVLLNNPNIILEYGYEINKTILKFIKEDKDLFEIYNEIAKEFYRKEKYIPSDYFWFLRDEEIKKIFLNSKNKTDLQTFIWSMGNDDIDGLKNIKRLFDFGVNENNIFDVIKIYEFVKPENILKLLKGKTLKNYLIYLYNFYNQRDVKTKNSEIRLLFKTSEKPIKLLNLIIKNIGEEKTYELIDGIFDYEMFDSEVTNPEELREIESNILWRNRNSNPNFNILFNFLVKVAHPKKFINNNEVNKYMVDFINKINTTPESWSVLLRMFMKESLNPREIIEIFDEIGNGIATETINKFDEYDKNHLLMSPKNEYQIKQILQQYGKLPKELTETTTPMNEIFNSLTSLQEELNEQRKVTIKESNLMKIQNFIKKKKNNQ